jgi:phage terminase large subunit
MMAGNSRLTTSPKKVKNINLYAFSGRTGAEEVWGLDVARFGNCRTALAKRRGNHLIEPVKSWAKRDLMQVSGLIMDEYTRARKRPDIILVDSIGLGAGVVDRLKEMGLPVRGINVGETPSGKDRFNRLRDELWWRCREWFESRDCRIPDDEKLIGQLTGLQYSFTSTEKIQVESKNSLLQRGKESPDEADAFVLTHAPFRAKRQFRPLVYDNRGVR